MRRYPASSAINAEKINKGNNCQQVHKNMYVNKNNIEEEDDDDDFSRYSLRPNLSLFNISIQNLNHKLADDDEEGSPQIDWLDDVFHSTKIEGY